MPHIEEALDKIVEQDLKTKNLEDETSLLDAKIKEFREARAALIEAAKIYRPHPGQRETADG